MNDEIKTLNDLKTIGYRGLKIKGVTPGTDPDQTEEQLVEYLKSIIDNIVDGKITPQDSEILDLED